jgi:hypothetical protein
MVRVPRTWVGAALAVASVGLGIAAGCTTTSSTSPAASAPASKVIGSGGGTIGTSDGTAQVDIPEGALPADTTITITPNADAPAPPDSTVVGVAYTFGPQGLTFAKPITVTLAFDPSKLPAGLSPSAIVVFTAPDGTSVYEPLPTSVKDATHVSATTTHFSTDDPAIPCFHHQLALVCPPPGGCPAGGPSCASDPCGSIGAIQKSCTDQGGGYDAICCGSATPGPGDCFHHALAPFCPGGACPSGPGCASDPCASIGATQQSCTDLGGGYDAVCCLPPGSTAGDGGLGDAGAVDIDSGSDAGSCTATSSGVGTTCTVDANCNGHAYSLMCNGMTCYCTTDASQTNAFTQSNVCGLAQNIQTAYSTGCNYPGAFPDGG